MSSTSLVSRLNTFSEVSDLVFRKSIRFLRTAVSQLDKTKTPIKLMFGDGIIFFGRLQKYVAYSFFSHSYGIIKQVLREKTTLFE
jgi:hypothetical protein